MSALDIYNEWCQREGLSQDEKAELLVMKNDEIALQKAFGANLHFGTAGLRGIMGVGTNCMNRFTISWATAGLADWLLSTNNKGARVVISTDSRLNHTEFAHVTAQVLAAYGFAVLLWEAPTATPILSWSVRHFGCACGIMITASHNPRDYNGYKAYDATGCQLDAHDASMVTDFAEAYIGGKALPALTDFNTLVRDDRVRLLRDEVNDYLTTIEATVRPLQVAPGTPLSIGLTPLHGVGGSPVKKVLTENGFSVKVVENQFAPDGHFPTIATPNPELAVAFDGLFDLARVNDLDVLIATDPDSDRIGVAAKNKDGEWVRITGNELGALLIDFLATVRGVNEGDTIITTIVTSNFPKQTAHYHGFKLVETFTGFKYIGGCVTAMENDASEHFVLGFEESYGYLYGTHARDKDAIVTSYLVAAMAQYDKAQGRSLIGHLEDLYKKVGSFSDSLINVVFDPIPGRPSVSDALMENVREHPPTVIAGQNVTKKIDYINGIHDLPPENVIQYELANGSVVCLRPSGTEPKMKCYISARGETMPAAADLNEAITSAFHELLARLKEDALT